MNFGYFPLFYNKKTKIYRLFFNGLQIAIFFSLNPYYLKIWIAVHDQAVVFRQAFDVE